MPIAKRVIDLHKGTIEIDSAVGQGTTVTIRLPAELQSEAVS
jgi:signal transduction histidine kinase